MSARLRRVSTLQTELALSARFAFLGDLWALSVGQTEQQRQLERAASGVAIHQHRVGVTKESIKSFIMVTSLQRQKEKQRSEMEREPGV